MGRHRSAAQVCGSRIDDAGTARPLTRRPQRSDETKSGDQDARRDVVGSNGTKARRLGCRQMAAGGSKWRLGSPERPKVALRLGTSRVGYKSAPVGRGSPLQSRASAIFVSQCSAGRDGNVVAGERDVLN